jgi:hypothetical protein
LRAVLAGNQKNPVELDLLGIFGQLAQVDIQHIALGYAKLLATVFYHCIHDLNSLLGNFMLAPTQQP